MAGHLVFLHSDLAINLAWADVALATITLAALTESQSSLGPPLEIGVVLQALGGLVLASPV